MQLRRTFQLRDASQRCLSLSWWHTWTVRYNADGKGRIGDKSRTVPWCCSLGPRDESKSLGIYSYLRRWSSISGSNRLTDELAVSCKSNWEYDSTDSNFARPSPWYEKWPVNQKHYRQYAYKLDGEGRSRNHCCRGKALSIVCSECVSVALVIQHTNAVLRILSSVACSVLQYFFTLS
jgi:hypothetical protein